MARDAARRDGHVVAVATMLDECGYTEMWKQDKSPEAPGRLENLKELIRALGDFETLAGFLDHVALVMENDENGEGDRLSLMTLHGAKGLEFDTVFLPGWEEGLFPNQRALDEGGVEGAGGGAAACLCRPDPGAQAGHRQPRRQPPHLRQLAEQHPEPLPRGTAGRQIEHERLAALARDAHEMPLGLQRPFPLVARRPKVIEAVGGAGAPGPGEAIGRHRVFHQKFGYGRVTAVEDDQLDIAFEKAGREARARPLRGEGVSRTPRALPPLETITIEVPEQAVEAFEAALQRSAPRSAFSATRRANLARRGPASEAGAGERNWSARWRWPPWWPASTARAAFRADPGRGLAGPHRERFPEQPIGRRFLVRATHLPDRRPRRVALRLDAGLAFGCGEHDSTRGCLLAFEQVAHRRPRRMLDLGTGSGILAMAAAKLLHRRVLATDIEPWSVRVAAENARLNGVHGWFRRGLRMAGGTGAARPALRPGIRQYPGPAALRHGA